jgi:hypothetical protein
LWQEARRLLALPERHQHALAEHARSITEDAVAHQPRTQIDRVVNIIKIVRLKHRCGDRSWQEGATLQHDQLRRNGDECRERL